MCMLVAFKLHTYSKTSVDRNYVVLIVGDSNHLLLTVRTMSAGSPGFWVRLVCGFITDGTLTLPIFTMATMQRLPYGLSAR